MAENDLGIEERLRRKMARPARVKSIATRFTEAEAKRIAEAAAERGVTVREWAREAMLQATAGTQTDIPVLTELLALRMLMNGVLRETAVGRAMTPEQYQALVTEVKKIKHEVARDVLTQYQSNEQGRAGERTQ